LQSLLSAGCSFLQFVHLSCGHGEWASAHSWHVWSHLWCVSPHHLHLYCEVHMLVLCVRLQHLRHCWFSFVSRHSLMRTGCPQPKIVLRSISSLNDSGFSRAITIDECFLLLM
jgi:hypothetical protein